MKHKEIPRDFFKIRNSIPIFPAVGRALKDLTLATVHILTCVLDTSPKQKSFQRTEIILYQNKSSYTVLDILH